MLLNVQILTCLTSTSDDSLNSGPVHHEDFIARVNRLKFLGHDKAHLNGPLFSASALKSDVTTYCVTLKAVS